MARVKYTRKTTERINKTNFKELLKLESEDTLEFISDESEYQTTKSRMMVRCLLCGNEFESDPDEMIRRGRRCKCTLEANKKEKSQELFERELIDTYGYNPFIFLTPYTKSTAYLKVKCKKCGAIKEVNYARNLIYSRGDKKFTTPPCKCFKTKKVYYTEDVRKKLLELSNGKADYEFLNETYSGDIYEKLDVKCLKCNHEFSATYANLKLGITKNKKLGYYCPNCNNMKHDNRSYEEKLKDINPTIINLEPYVNRETKIKHKCLKCNFEWITVPNNRLKGEGCPKCSNIIKESKMEREIKEYIKSIYKGKVIANSRKILGNGQELDIYIPDKNLAIEVDGVYWHNYDKKGKDYHLNKTLLCEKKNIQLIHLFSSDYVTDIQKKIVQSKIKHLLKCNDNPKVYARKCYVEEIDSKDKNQFLNENHIQGKDNSAIKLGLWYPLNEEEDLLVAVMTFCKPRKALGQKKDKTTFDYELSRFATDINYQVVGAFGKLWKYFINHYEFKKIITYADRRWSVGNVYKTNGFTLDHISKPSYWYFDNSDDEKLYYRYTFRKTRLKELFPDIYSDDKTELQIMEEAGYRRVYDCGNLVFIYEK